MRAPPFPAAAREAVRDAVKAQLRSTSNAEDVVLEQYAGTALGLAEAFTGTALILRDWTERLPVECRWRKLGMIPVGAITAVTGLPAEGAGFALPADAYAIDLDASGQGWVRVHAPGAAGRIEVTYSAGLAADFAGLPEPLAQGVVLLACHLFEARLTGAAPPAAVSALWRPWRRVRLAGAVR